MSHWEFLQDAMRRLEVGEQSYTWSAGGRLLGCAWLSGPKTMQKAGSNNFSIPEDAALLQGFYLHPEGQDQFQDFLAAVATAVAKEQKEEMLYAAVTAKDKNLCQNLEALGFKKVHDI
jgi:hypothetical protein